MALGKGERGANPAPMDADLYRLFGLEAPQSIMRQQDMVIDESPSGRAIRHSVIKPDPWLRRDDVRDALMTFAIVFVGAMMFLID